MKERATLAVLFLALLATAAAAADSDDNVQQMGKEPIVIESPLTHYDQPTLDEYRQCHENRERCLSVCESAAKPSLCRDECPSCPVLIDQDVLVQGINDTNYRAPPQVAVNTTHYVKLNYTLHNVVDNHLGNITAHTDNQVHIHQNISTTGGKYGLGYNKSGACCLVLRSASQGCSGHGARKRSASGNGSICSRKQRVCGERCKARYMHAKRVTYCAEDGSDCQHRMEYTPYRRRRVQRQTGAGRCSYTPQWPFVNCGRQQSCSRCLALPYVYVLQHGVPPQCRQCYASSGYGQSQYAPPAYMPYYQPPVMPMPMPMPVPDFIDFNYMHRSPAESEDKDHGWVTEKRKCLSPEGVVSEDCLEAVPQGQEHAPTEEETNVPQDDFNGDADYDYGDSDDDYFVEEEQYAEPAARHRRHTFQRSAYSTRHGRSN